MLNEYVNFTYTFFFFFLRRSFDRNEASWCVCVIFSVGHISLARCSKFGSVKSGSLQGWKTMCNPQNCLKCYACPWCLIYPLNSACVKMNCDLSCTMDTGYSSFGEGQNSLWRWQPYPKLLVSGRELYSLSIWSDAAVVFW
jgi:hypothetical protein